MKIKTIVVVFLSGLLTACTTATSTALPTVTIALKASPIPSQTSQPSFTPIPRSTQTPVPTVAPTSEAYPVLERVAQMGGSINGITIVGDVAYVGMGPRVAAIDISQHESPGLMSQSEPLPGLVTQLLQISDGLLLVSNGKYLEIMDISNPKQLTTLQQLELSGGISALVLDDRTNILYAGGAIQVAPGSLGYDGFITAVAVTLDSRFTIINSVTMPEIPLSLALGEESLYAGTNGYEGGLYHIQVKSSGELSTPRQVIASTPETPLVPTGMQVIGERLYLGYWGVEAYDITNPEQPVKVWSGYAPGMNIVTDFTVDRDHVYATGFSIREPDIQVFGAVSASDQVNGGPIGRIASNTSMHKADFVVANKILKIFNTTDPMNLRLMGSYQGSVTNAMDAAANESAVYVVDNGVADGQSKAILWVLGLPDLQPLGQVNTEFPNNYWEGLLGIAIEGDRVYLATKDTIWVYGISSLNPTLLGKVSINEKQQEAISALNVGERRLLFTLQSTEDKYNVLWVYDLTDLQKPTTTSNHLPLDQGWGAQMTWTGSTLFIFLERSYFSDNDLLYAVSFYNDVLELKGSMALTGYTDREAADDNLIALTSTSTSMERSIVSIFQSKTLKLLSTFTLPENGMGVAIIGDRALVAVGGSWDMGGEAQLLTIDLQSLLDPRQVDEMDIAFCDNYNVPILHSQPYVILANGAGGVELLEYTH
jgi:hypothetical protein